MRSLITLSALKSELTNSLLPISGRGIAQSNLQKTPTVQMNRTVPATIYKWTSDGLDFVRVMTAKLLVFTVITL